MILNITLFLTSANLAQTYTFPEILKYNNYLLAVLYTIVQNLKKKTFSSLG